MTFDPNKVQVVPATEGTTYSMILGPDGKPAPVPPPEPPKHQVGFYAYETVGYTPVDPYPQPVPTVEEIAARFREALVPFIGKTNVTQQLVTAIKEQVADILDAHGPRFTVEAVPEESTPDKLTVRIRTDDPVLGAMLREAMNAPTGDASIEMDFQPEKQ